MKEKRRSVSNPFDNRFAFYHQNEALLFQFLLHECLRAHQILRKKPNFELFLQVAGNFDSVPTGWQAPSGHLPRLLHYCTLLSAHFESSSLCKDLGQTLERAYLKAKQCYINFKSEEHLKHYADLRKDMLIFMKFLFIKLYDFKENASVLYFLLRHQEQFDALYREPIIQKKFSVFFPEGIKQAQLFLTEKFSKKGFNHLIPYIEQKLKKLDLPRSSKTKRNAK
jgi:hypothetical protein